MIKVVEKYFYRRTCPHCRTKHLFEIEDIVWVNKILHKDCKIITIKRGYIRCLNCGRMILVRKRELEDGK